MHCDEITNKEKTVLQMTLSPPPDENSTSRFSARERMLNQKI